MAFNETVRFPDDIGYLAKGGPKYSVQITETEAGYEQRNLNFSQTRASYSINGILTTKQLSGGLSWINLNNFFNAHNGELYGFRFKDFKDFSASVATGTLDKGIGTGKKKYQLTKKYLVSDLINYRDIYKPINNGKLDIYKNGVKLTQGSSAGNYSIDYTSGVVTFVPTITKTINSITSSGTVATITTSATHGFTVGKLIYFSNLPNLSINNRAYVIASIPTTTTFTIAYLGIITSGVLGNVEYYDQQPTDNLTATFEFDVPCRFDMPQLNGGLDESGLISIDSINLIELRIKTVLY